MAAVTSVTPRACPVVASATAATSPSTWVMPATMRPSAPETSAAVPTPAAALAWESSISRVVPRAASALRRARARTSSATTANPRPALPARAASTAAFRASRLVWKAISSMVRMILAVSPLAVRMSAMAVSRRDMAALPASVAWRSSAVVRRAWLAAAALRSVAAVTCCRAVALCWAAVAWRPAWSARSPFSAARHAAASAMPCASSSKPAAWACRARPAPRPNHSAAAPPATRAARPAAAAAPLLPARLRAVAVACSPHSRPTTSPKPSLRVPFRMRHLVFSGAGWPVGWITRQLARSGPHDEDPGRPVPPGFGRHPRPEKAAAIVKSDASGPRRRGAGVLRARGHGLRSGRRSPEPAAQVAGRAGHLCRGRQTPFFPGKSLTSKCRPANVPDP